MAIKLGASNWIALGALLVTVLGGGTALLGNIFASKASVQELKLTMADTGKGQLQEWRTKVLETKVSNLELRLSRTDQNLVLLLQRFRVTPAAEPVYEPIPVRPTE